MSFGKEVEDGELGQIVVERFPFHHNIRFFIINLVCLLLLMLKSEFPPPFKKCYVGSVFPLSPKCILSRLPLVSFSSASWSQLSKRHCGETEEVNENFPPATTHLICSQTAANGQCKLSLITGCGGMGGDREESRWESLSLRGSIGRMNRCNVFSLQEAFLTVVCAQWCLCRHTSVWMGCCVNYKAVYLFI